MLLRICHTTRFEYQAPAYDSHNEARMRPLEGATQRCVEFDLELTPDVSTFEYDDYYGNRVDGFWLHAPRPFPLSEPMRKFFWLAKPDPAEDVALYANRIVAFIRDQFVYEPGMTKVHSTADEILSVGGGGCQDFAHLTIGVLRLAGIPTRYVSGYLAPAAKSRVETVVAQGR